MRENKYNYRNIMICPNCRYEYTPKIDIHKCKCPACKQGFIKSVIEISNDSNPLNLLRDSIRFLGVDSLKNKKLLLILVSEFYLTNEVLQKLLSISINEEISIAMFDLVDVEVKVAKLNSLKNKLITEAFLSEAPAQEIIDSWCYILDFDENEKTIRKFDNYHYINSKGELVFKTDEDGFNLDFSEGLAYTGLAFKYYQKYINIKGEIVIDLNPLISKFDGVANYYKFGEFLEGFATVNYKSSNFGFIDKKANLIIDCIYQDALPFSNGLAAVKLNDLWGYINQNGEIVIKHKYDEVYPFIDGLALVNGNDNWTLIDTKGKIIHSLNDISKAELFNNNVKKYKNYKSINKTNIDEELLYHNECKELFEDGYKTIEKLDYDIMLFSKSSIITDIDEDGEEYEFKNIEYLLYNIPLKKQIKKFKSRPYKYSCGLAIIAEERSFGKQYGYIDKNGIEIIPPQFNFVRPFFGGFAFVSNKTQWEFGENFNITLEDDYTVSYSEEKSFMLLSLINTKGEIIVKDKFIEASDFKDAKSDVQLYFSKNKIERGYINSKGNWIFSERNSIVNIKTVNFLFKYDQVKKYSDGLLAVCFNQKWGFVDKKGNEVIPLRFKRVSDFVDGLAKAQEFEYDKWALINTNNVLVTEFKYSFIGDFKRGYAVVVTKDVSLGHSCGCIDKDGKEVFPLIYDGIKLDLLFEDLYCINYKNKWGFIDIEGNEMIEFKYDRIGKESDGLVMVGVGKQYCNEKEWIGRFDLINRDGVGLINGDFESIGFMPFKCFVNGKMAFYINY